MANAVRLLGLLRADRWLFVTLPLALPIAVVKRFITMVQGFNIPTGGVIVNGVIPEKLIKNKKVTEYLINKYKEQQECMKIIKRRHLASSAHCHCL